MNRIEKTFEKFLFFSRWFQLPIYLGLVVATILYVVKFVQQIISLTSHFLQLEEVKFMTEILDLIDTSMVINLLVVVFIGGYCTFVSKIGFENSEDKPEWLSKINANSLKVKLIVALVSITGVHLLKTFISLNALPKGDVSFTNLVVFQIAIHLIFVLSAILLAYADRIAHSNKSQEK
jgi:uncharacterized protein (TIGR00645 family)